MIFLFFLSLYLSNLWTRFEDVDNLTAFWFCHVKVLLLLLWYYYYFYFSSRRSLLESELLFKRKKITKQKWKKKRMSGIVRTFISAFYFLIHFQSYLPSHLHPWLYYLGFFFLSPHIWFLFLCVCLFFNFKNNEFCYLLLVYRCSAVMHT